MTKALPEPLRWLSRGLYWALWTIALLLIALALVIAAGRQFIPLLGAYAQTVSAKASQALGVPVEIGTRVADWPGLTPRVKLEKLHIGQGQQPLAIGGLEARLDLVGSLLARRWQLERLQVQDLSMTLREDPAGHWQLDGFADSGGQPFDPQPIFDNIGRLGRVGLHRVRLKIEPQGQQAIELNNAELSLSQQWRGPRLDGLIQLPDGRPMSFSLQLEPYAGDWQRSGGRLYLNLPQTDWATWIPHSLLAGWQLQRLQAGAELWLVWGDRQLLRGALRLNSQQAQLRYQDHQPLNMEDLGLTAVAQRRKDGYLVQVDPLAVSIGKHRLSAGGLTLRQQRDGNGHDHWRLASHPIDVGVAVPVLLDSGQLPPKIAELISQLQPRGWITKLKVDYQPQAPRDEQLNFSAYLRQVSFAPVRGVPGASGVQGVVHGGLDGGELNFDSRHMQLHLATLFEQPWTFYEASGRLSWHLEKGVTELIGQHIRTQGPLGDINAQLRLHDVDGNAEQSFLDLRVGMVNTGLDHLPELLPVRSKGFSPELRAWLQNALHGGRVQQGFFVYQGVLKEQGQPNARQMDLYVDARDTELHYQRGWPALEHVDAQVFMEDDKVQVSAPHAQVLASQISDISALVDKDANGHSHVQVKAALASSIPDALRFMDKAPLAGVKGFAGWHGQGPLQGDLNLDVPLAGAGRSKVVMNFATTGAELHIDQPQMYLQDLQGNFTYDSEHGLKGDGIKTRLDGQPLTAHIRDEGRNGKFRSRVLASGTMPWSALVKRFKLGNAKLPIAGKLPYELDLLLTGTGGELKINSSLQGLAIDLPAPFGKSADESRPSSMALNFAFAAHSGQRISADYNGLAKLALAMPAGGLQNLRGELHIGPGVAVLPSQSGLWVNGQLSSLDVEQWQKAYQRFARTRAGVGATSGKGQGGAGVFRGAKLSIGQVNTFGQQINNVQAAFNRQTAAWALRVDSEQIAGSLLLPDQDRRPMVLALDHLRLPELQKDAEGKTSGKDPLADFDPHRLPAMDVSVKQLYLGSALLGKWSFNVRPNVSGVRFETIDLQLKKHLGLTGTLDWTLRGGVIQSQFNGDISGKRLQDVLTEWGYVANISAQDFLVQANVSWPGSLAAVSLNTLSGTAQAHIERGRFNDVQGAASAVKVFGLLNFDALGRRLRLDFSDVLGSGLQFDDIKGKLVVENGRYRTDKTLKMRGSSADIDLTGALDLSSNQVDAQVQVTLPLSNNVTMAAVMAGAPAVGGALWVINRAFGNHMDRLVSVRYHLSGPLDKPDIQAQKAKDQ